MNTVKTENKHMKIPSKKGQANLNKRVRYP